MSEHLRRRVQHTAGSGWLSTAPDDGGKVQQAQVKINDLQTIDRVPVVHHFGFSSAAPINSMVVRLSMAGDTSNGVIVGTLHQSSRPTGLSPGQSLQYDLFGSRVFCANDGTIHISAPGEALRKLVTEVFMELFNQHTHPANGSPPTQKMTTAHLTGGLRAGGP
ncbi:phage baseplate assembly protein domain-containing protein [Roseomonas chloroacetimidivorans]|uniref:phage baseplate assembly protein domain-containing protein n=1 Tax=Roseomonas chloroacetimidivorans TaxID=1766656 RepID=UPI003C7413CD